MRERSAPDSAKSFNHKLTFWAACEARDAANAVRRFFEHGLHVVLLDITPVRGSRRE